MAVLPAEIPTGLVTGHYYFVNEDNIDADTDPELTVVTGTVRFTASVKTLRMPSKKAVLVPLTFDGVFDSQGNLTPLNGTGVGMELPATNSPLFTEQDYTWRVEFNLKEAGTTNTVNLDSFDIQVPVGSTQDLSELIPVAASGGVLTIQGPSTVLSIGTVTEGQAAASLTGESPTQVLNLVIPKGDTGDLTDLTIGPVTGLAAGSTPTAAITGEAPNKVLALGIPQGVKGDPGGIVPSIGLNPGADLNAVVSPGIYRVVGANATLALNYPKTGYAGMIMVMASSSTILTQVYYPLNATVGSVTYTRSLVGTTWGTWVAFNSTRVSQTAGRAIYQWDDLNNREQLIYGDTGWRDIRDGVLNGALSTKLKIRRVGSQVSIVGMIDLTVATNDHFMTIPQGFNPDIDAHAGFASGLDAGKTVRLISTGVSTLYIASGLNPKTIWNIVANYHTTSPWPTTLPGVAVGVIPNL